MLNWAQEKGLSINNDFVTFDIFVKYICHQEFFEMDRHWMPQHVALWHPIIDYSFIGRYESFVDDFEYVLEEIQASDILIDTIGLKENPGTGIVTAFTEETANCFMLNLSKILSYII